jgi:hypothetical protein
MDVAQALYSLCVDKSVEGKTFKLVGDEEYTEKEIVDYILDMTKEDPSLLNLPLSLAEIIAQNFPDPKFTHDFAIRQGLDQVKSSDLPGLLELGVEPTKLEKEAFSFLLKYNKGGHFPEVTDTINFYCRLY